MVDIRAELDELVTRSENIINGEFEGRNFDPTNEQHMHTVDGAIGFIVNNSGKFDHASPKMVDLVKDRVKEEVLERNEGTTVTTEVNNQQVITGRIIDSIADQLNGGALQDGDNMWDKERVADYAENYNQNRIDNPHEAKSFNDASVAAFESNGMPLIQNAAGVVNSSLMANRLGTMINDYDANQAQGPEAQSMESPAVDSSATAVEAHVDESPTYDAPPAM